MHPELDERTLGFGLAFHVHKVHAEGGRQGREGGVGAGVGGGGDAEQKRDSDQHPQVVQGQHGVKIVGFFQERNAFLGGVEVEQRPQRQEK